MLAVSMALLVSGEPALVHLGGFLTLPVLLACIGCLLRGWEGGVIGLLTGLVLYWLIVVSALLIDAGAVKAN